MRKKAATEEITAREARFSLPGLARPFVSRGFLSRHAHDGLSEKGTIHSPTQWSRNCSPINICSFISL